jgi:hypothetical protein
MCRLRPLIFLTSVVAAGAAAFSVVFTLWLSITPALGEASGLSLARHHQ